jgi:RAB protein geranylgeranyltransferase component A
MDTLYICHLPAQGVCALGALVRYVSTTLEKETPEHLAQEHVER